MPRKKQEEAEEEREEEKKEPKEEEEKEPKVEKKIEEKEKKEPEKLLVPLEDYINVAIHLGTRAITPGMRQFVYRRKADGIAVLNTKKIDERLALAADFIAKYEPGDIIACCRRDAGKKAIEAFGEATNIKVFTRYPPGMITNPDLEDFFEPKLLFIIDPWLDKNVLMDAVKIKVPIVALCDTNNITDYIDVIVPCNNKAPKSIGLALYILAKLYLKNRKVKKRLNADDFYEPPEEETVKRVAKKLRLKEKAEEAIEEKIKEKMGIGKKKGEWKEEERKETKEEKIEKEEEKKEETKDKEKE